MIAPEARAPSHVTWKHWSGLQPTTVLAGAHCWASLQDPRGRQPRQYPRVSDLSGLPPIFIGVGALDLFLNEGIGYARRLINSGVATQLDVVPGAFHGFDDFSGTAVADCFRQTLISALRKGLAVKDGGKWP